MSLVRRSATIAALALVLTGPALSADAATTNWKTLVPFDGAKLQACKVSTTATGPWKVKLRVDASKATGKVRGGGQVLKNGKPTPQSWDSRWVQKGAVSSVGTVHLTRGSAFTLSAGIGGTQAGNGGEFKAAKIPLC